MRLALLLLTVLVLAFAPAPLPRRGKSPPSLDGKWVYESQTIGGWELPKADRSEIWVEIKDGSFFRCATRYRQESRLILDPTRQPNEFVLEFRHPITGKTSRSMGIYRREGDRLVLCYDNSGRTRPSTFQSPEGREEIVLSVMRKSEK